MCFKKDGNHSAIGHMSLLQISRNYFKFGTSFLLIPLFCHNMIFIQTVDFGLYKQCKILQKKKYFCALMVRFVNFYSNLVIFVTDNGEIRMV